MHIIICYLLLYYLPSLLPSRFSASRGEEALGAGPAPAVMGKGGAGKGGSGYARRP